jgi:hypothetical protein
MSDDYGAPDNNDMDDNDEEGSMNYNQIDVRHTYSS